MSDTRLQYRRSDATGDRIAERLRQREWMESGRIALHIAVGVPCLLIGPIILSSIYFALAVMWFGAYASWSLIFWGSIVVLVPLLFWTERRTHGNYFSDTVREANPDGTRSVSYAALGSVGMLAAFIANPRLSASGFVELFLFGPRMILEAVASLQRVRALRGVHRGRAADLLADLLGRPSGTDMEQVLHEGESVESLLPCIAYLLYYEWIDISTTRDRIWVLSDARVSLLQS